MQIRSLRPPRSRYLERGAGELSREAQKRLAWLDYYQAHGRKAALTCRYFGISRQTFYRWKRRYDPQNLHTLEAGSHRPHRRRRATWSAERGGLLEVSHVQQAYERAVGHAVPKSTVYRMLARHGWRKLAPRPRHPQADASRQQAFKKTPRDH